MSEKITKSINIGIMAIIFVLLALITIPRVFADPVNVVDYYIHSDNINDQITVIDNINSQISIANPVLNSGIWVVVTKDGQPLKDRKITIAQVNGVSNNYITNEYGLVYTELKTGTEHKIIDVLTNRSVLLKVYDTEPKLINLKINDFEVSDNSEYPEGIYDLKITVRDEITNDFIPKARVILDSEDYSSTPRTFITDEQGFLLIDYMQEGNFSFKILGRNYIEQEMFFTLKENSHLEFYLTPEGSNIQKTYLISFEDCAVDKTEIIIPRDNVRSQNTVYKSVCKAQGYIDYNRKVISMSQNESYVAKIDLILNEDTKEVPKAKLIFSNQEGICYVKDMDVSQKNNFSTSYVSKLIKEDLSQNYKSDLGQIANGCGTNTIIEMSATFYDSKENVIFANKDDQSISRLILSANKDFYDSTEVVSRPVITYEDYDVFVDSINPASADKVNQVNQNRDMIQNQEIKRVTEQEVQNDRSIVDSKTTNRDQIISNNSDLFVNIDGESKKVIPIETIFSNEKIDPNKVISDIKIENTEYVFEVLQERKLLGFIPFGERIVQKRISATKEILE